LKIRSKCASCSRQGSRNAGHGSFGSPLPSHGKKGSGEPPRSFAQTGDCRGLLSTSSHQPGRQQAPGAPGRQRSRWASKRRLESLLVLVQWERILAPIFPHRRIMDQPAQSQFNRGGNIVVVNLTAHLQNRSHPLQKLLALLLGQRLGPYLSKRPSNSWANCAPRLGGPTEMPAALSK
jgi:hypothetical protein